ncbi:MAG: flagellar hook assembly protein FlgD [Fimbriimonadaceae bacterium]
MNTIDPTGANTYTNFGGVPKAKSELNMDAFLRLLTVQLANQNPLEPMNDRDFFAQMAQLGQVEGMDGLQSSLDTLNGAAMIGKTVTAVRPMTDANSGGVNSLVTGTVARITMRDGKQILGLKEANGGIVEVQIGSIREIK